MIPSEDGSELLLREMLTKVSKKKKERLLDMLMDIEKQLDDPLDDGKPPPRDTVGLESDAILSPK